MKQHSPIQFPVDGTDIRKDPGWVRLLLFFDLFFRAEGPTVQYGTILFPSHAFPHSRFALTQV
jgi:hypothetical protein